MLTTYTEADWVPTVLLGLGILHTFSVKRFRHWAALQTPDSLPENLLHLLGEVEVVFGIWAGIYVIYLTISGGSAAAVEYVESLDFSEPTFVFVIMAVASTRPILALADAGIRVAARCLPLPMPMASLFATLTLGALSGSLITEPAAMTVTALLLRNSVLADPVVSERSKYWILGTLFVNVSVGGVLTNFAAPPVLMVAAPWGWDSKFMLSHFGWKAALAVVINSALVVALVAKELRRSTWRGDTRAFSAPGWVILLHLVFLALIILTSHHISMFVGLFLFFVGCVAVTREHQDELKLKESLLVGFFLAGLVVLGGPQRWWLEPLLSNLNATMLYVGASALTAITDNAALTFLGAQVPNLSDPMKYALVAGAVSGGGLTVIANAPNPAGYSILQDRFGPEGIKPAGLFLGALIPTSIAMVTFWILR